MPAWSCLATWSFLQGKVFLVEPGSLIIVVELIGQRKL